MRAALVVMALAMVGCIEVTRAEYPPAPFAPQDAQVYDPALNCEADYLGSGLYCCEEDYRDPVTEDDCILVTCGQHEPRRVQVSVSAYGDADANPVCAKYGPSHCATSPYGPALAPFDELRCEIDW